MSTKAESPATPARARHSGRTMACVGCLAAMLLAMLAVMLFFAITARNGTMQRLYETWVNVERCRQNMVELGDALERYHNRNDKYPAKLDDLYPDYLNEDDVLWCPTVKARPQQSNYVYRRPKANAEDSTIAVQCFRHVPPGNENIVLSLRLNGSIEVDTMPSAPIDLRKPGSVEGHEKKGKEKVGDNNESALREGT